MSTSVVPSFTKRSFRATKSVSQSSSSTTAFPGSIFTKILPAPVARPLFFAAAARPCSFSRRTALSKSPSAFTRAFLQSIMPAPVFSRRRFTSAAVMSTVHHSL